MPTDNRRLFIQQRARKGFEQGRCLEGEELSLALLLAETQLESATRQREVLTELALTGNLKGPR